MRIFAALSALGLAQTTTTARSPEPSWSRMPAAPLRKLSDVPGVAVRYYDAVGKTVPELHDWLAKHGARDPQTHKVTPATSSWSIGSAVKWSRAGKQCTLTGVTLKFTATAELPRLAAGVKLAAPMLSSWNAYVTALEDRQAAQLAFVHDRLGEVERAIMRSNCGNWQKAAAAAITRLGEEQGQAFKLDPATQPRLLEPGTTP
jgi:predicted secreted Zn-dependent protease